jgi:AsmA family/AsmA-like C-terminal region
LASYVQAGTVKVLKSKRRLLLVMAALLVVLFILRPGANGLRKRIVSSVGMAIGRRVEVQWVKLRLLPEPGFDLENFIVYDDPAFGAEPMLRADEVTATLRLRSLFRGRLEIGRLSLKEPSFNLVRGEDGHWNVEALLDRVAHTPAAPTSHTRPERRPVFPYIEADDGRINFKIGQEKKAYALTNADFALWLESENQWGMRLAARPVRTDFNLSDTGIVHAEGTWQRSGSLRETPLKFTVEWERAQLGQFSKLISGRDKGWRGGVSLVSSFSGTPADLTLTGRATIEDFRRYDIVSSNALRLAAACTAHYSSIEHAVSNLVCQSPLSEGTLILAGVIHSPTGPRSYDLALLAQDIPVQPLVSLARHAKQDLPDDLTGKGVFNGEASMRTVKDARGEHLAWSGEGAIEDFRLASTAAQVNMSSDRIPLIISSGNAARPAAHRMQAVEGISGSRLDVGPFTVAIGTSSAATVSGWSSASAYDFRVEGESQIQRLIPAAHTIGLHAPQLNAGGTAKLHLEIAGHWADFAYPIISGSTQLSSVRAELPGTGPLEIESANLVWGNGTVQTQNLSAVAGGTHWSGTVSFPQSCRFPDCTVEMNLQADSIYVDRFRGWLNPKPRNKPWYRMLASSKPPDSSLLTSIKASGTVSAGHVLFRGLDASDVRAQIAVNDGHVVLSDVRGGLLGGQHLGTWEADLQATPPTYSGSGRFEQVSLSGLAKAMHSDWITGTGKGAYRFRASGGNAKQAWKSASATLSFEVGNGVLAHVGLAPSGPPLRVRRFAGQLLLQDGEFKIAESKLETATRTFDVTGTATLGQKIDVMLAGAGPHGFNVTGTLSEPRVSPTNMAETQAALKP